MLVPKAMQHLLKVLKQLQDKSYLEIINQAYENNPSKGPIKVIVKSYFWASRLLKDCECLPRSIAIYQHLLAAGHDVQHKFGVNKDNQELAAHAWVEYKQKPLNEAIDLKLLFKVLEPPENRP